MAVMGTSALLGAAAAQADPGGDSKAPGGSGSGAISSAIEEFGQSLCPSLVKPGSELATAISQMQGNDGLTPALTGMVTGLAIQMQCPALMTQVANGDLSALSALKMPGAEPDPLALLHPPGE